ncbi:MAG: flagellin [Myxococcales bacterium]|nr:flagellin [Myxococcales bacterium]MCB9540552.1 flagellin [Myxococcales bacterium]
MGLFVNTNVASLNAQRNLLNVSSKLGQSFERLSSGLRINRAADDAAGLSISERFTSQVRGLTQAARNANDGISLAQVAEGALQEATSIVQRVRELSVQAASDVNNETDREALQNEVSQLIAELARIGDTTTFNNQKVLDGTFIASVFHIGMNFREGIALSVDDARAKTLGRSAVRTGASVTTAAIGTDEVLINGVTIRATQPADDAVSTSFATGSAIAKAAAINDSSAFTQVEAYANATVATGGADIGGGTLDATNNVRINGRTITGFTVTQDDADDGLIVAINAEAAITGVVASRTAEGRVELTAEDGRNIEVVASGTGAAITGLSTGVAFGTLTLHSSDQYQVTGGNEALIGFTPNALVGVSGVQAITTVDITTREGANLGILVSDRALEQLSGIRSRLGAIQNRLESTITNLTAVTENAAAARSRIQDADFAAETANLSRNQVLQQAATSILAQANAQPQNALSLLG